MRPSTEQALVAALQAVVLAACADARPTTPPPVPSADAPVNGGPVEIVSTSRPTGATSATAPPGALVENMAPTQLEYGQRCAGTIVRGLHPATPVDGIELRLEYFMPTHRILRAGRAGEPCAGAKDKSACLAAFEKARPSKGGEWLVFSRGDDVRAVSGAEVKALLVPIDSPEEAAAALVYQAADNVSGAAVLPTCDPAAYHPVSGGYEVLHETRGMCEESTRVTYRIDREGAVSETHREHTPPRAGCSPPHMGRRHEGFVENERRATNLGEYLAWCAEVEAASVPAFDRLEVELRRLRAPRTLLLRARAAQRDEVRHTSVMTSLARRHGASSAPIDPRTWEPREADDVAVDNAVEGCVLELFGALMATWQAQFARDDELRSSLEVIARDETRHAALAIDIARWFGPRISTEARDRIRDARQAAIARLRAECQTHPPSLLRREAGLPDPEESLALIDGLERIVETMIEA